MRETQIRMRRRPLLAPLLLPLFALLAAGIALFALSLWTRTTVVILVRHAEPASSQTGDPDLSPAGESRARRLGAYLDDSLPVGAVDHLYAADTRRAQQTAASVANQFKLPINLLGGSDWSGLASRIKREHRGATVVVVGFSASLQSLASELAGTAITLDDGDYGSILVVVLPSPGQPQVLRLRYGDGPATPLPSS